MDEKFNEALTKTLKHEGGYNNVEHDAGGATNWGISLRYLKDVYKSHNWVDVNGDGVVDAKDIKNLSKEQAAKLYYTQFWQRQHCDKIDNPVVAAKLFDMSVNMGLNQAAKIVQRAVNRFGIFRLTEDGILGTASISAINKVDSETLLVYIKAECALFYHELVIKKPEYSKFIRGWLRRAVQ